MAAPSIGDYVLASKWHDGDPKDPWAVGFLDGVVPGRIGIRYRVVNDKGMPFWANGFRRVKKITPARGKWLLENSVEIEASGRSVWWWLRRAMQPRAYR